MWDRRNYYVDLDVMRRLKAHSALIGRSMQDCHMEAISLYLMEQAEGATAKTARHTRKDSESSIPSAA